MRIMFPILIVMILYIVAAALPCLGSDLPAGSYFGLEPPGLMPEIFGPNIICFPNRHEISCVFSPDQREFILRIYSTTSYAQKLEDDNWTPLGPVYFAPNCGTPHFTPDGNNFFCHINNDVYTSKRIGDVWSDAVKIDYPISTSSAEYWLCPAANGNLYFCSARPGTAAGLDIYRSIPVAGQYTTVELLPAPITSSYGAWDPLIAPDESYMVLSVGRSNFFISFQTEPNSWTEPLNLGPNINTSLIEYGPRLSPDGKYFFFTRLTAWNPSARADIYWVDIRAVLPDPNGPIENLSTGQRFGSIQCAITYANDGDEIVLAPGTYQGGIDLSGKDIVLRSTEPNNPRITEMTIIKGDSQNPVVTFSHNQTTCVLQGLTLTDGLAGLDLQGASPRIEHCNIINNVGHGIEMSDVSHPVVSHTLICANGGVGILMTGYQDLDETIPDEPELINCTIAQNIQEGIKGGMPTLRNTIVWNNGLDQLAPVSATVSYSCIQGGYTGDGYIDGDPCFAQLAYRDSNSTPDDPNDDFEVMGDYHLKSQAGRFDPNSGAWVQDDVTSPCIDAGDPNTPVGDEPSPHGDRVNMGVYGGTYEASKSYVEESN